MNKEQKIKILLDFVQYILNQWDIDTKDVQDKALEVLNKIIEV